VRAPLLSFLPAAPALSTYTQKLGLSGAEAPTALARALAASPGWPPDAGARLLVRQGAHPVLAATGRFDAAGQAWLQGQAYSLAPACASLRYLDYPEAEAECRELAARLRTALGPDRLAAARFAAVPRGGLIVLGLLSVLLDLDRDQIGPPFPHDRPLVAVDDCIVSGARAFRFLGQTDHPEVVFAHLFSHPELRAAILEREPRVAACVSARDLTGRRLDLDREIPGDRYWSGEVEALCFPWNEPDRTFWNPVSERWELAWRIVPPELCLKNHPAPGTEPIPIQIQPEGKGPLRPSERALFAEIDGSVILFDLETGQGFHLGGAGSDLWRSIVRLGDLDAAVAALVPEYDVPEETLRLDARRFADDLLARGLLEARD
jgi:Coenzyme PQQ synthesis protein D (PqqD)